MEIEMTTTRVETITKHIKEPSFFMLESKYGLVEYLAIYNKEKVVKMSIGDNYANITRCYFRSINNADELTAAKEISEPEFNEALAKSLFIISGVEVCTPVEQLY